MHLAIGYTLIALAALCLFSSILMGKQEYVISLRGGKQIAISGMDLATIAIALMVTGALITGGANGADLKTTQR